MDGYRMNRRNKRDMELMKLDVRYYLLQTNNNYRQAYDMFVKDYLTRGEMLPYYIKGMKDFLNESQVLALELNRMDQMNKRDREIQLDKNNMIDYIMNISIDEMKAIYKAYKDDVSKSDKLILHDMYMMIYSNELDEKHISESTIRLFRMIMNDNRLNKVG